MSYFRIIDTHVPCRFQSPCGLWYLHCRDKHNVCYLRSTFGATPADLMMGTWAQPNSPNTVSRGEVARTQNHVMSLGIQGLYLAELSELV